MPKMSLDIGSTPIRIDKAVLVDQISRKIAIKSVRVGFLAVPLIALVVKAVAGPLAGQLTTAHVIVGCAIIVAMGWDLWNIHRFRKARDCALVGNVIEAVNITGLFQATGTRGKV